MLLRVHFLRALFRVNFLGILEVETYVLIKNAFGARLLTIPLEALVLMVFGD